MLDGDVINKMKVFNFQVWLMIWNSRIDAVCVKICSRNFLHYSLNITKLDKKILCSIMGIYLPIPEIWNDYMGRHFKLKNTKGLTFF